MTQNIKAKVQQNLYKGYSDMKFDFEQLRTEILLTMQSGFAIKEHVYEYLFSKSLALTEDFLSERETQSSNGLRLLQERLKTAEAEALRGRQELTHEKEQSFHRLQEGEDERIRLKTENAILQERLSFAKAEADELRLKLNCEYTEKLHELEMQVKAQKDELRRREQEIMDQTNETLRSSTEHAKKLALVEQERDFLRNDVGAAREQLARKDLEVADLAKQARA